MQPMQPAHIQADRHCSGQRNRRQGIRVCLLCRQAGKELHSVNICAPIYHATKGGMLCSGQPSADRNHAGRSIPHAINARRWWDSQPANAAQSSTTRREPGRNGSMQREPTPDCPGHVAPGKLCKFAQNRAVQALQTRPIFTTCNALQELYAAISNGLAAFRSTPYSAAQSSPDRPPGIDPLRLYAVGVEFS